MRTQTQLQHRKSFANRLETAVAIGIKAGTAGAIALALSLFMTDLSHWKGTTLGYKWQLSETHVKPGGWVTATLEIPESQDIGTFSLSIDLPPGEGFVFIPGSLEVYSGSLEGATIPGYSGESSLVIANIPPQTSALSIQIGIQTPHDLSWLGKSVEIGPIFSMGGSSFQHSSQVLNLDAPPLKVSTTAVAAPSGQLGYEVQVSNPANGLNFFDLGTAFSLEVEVDHPGSRLIAEQVEVSSSYACGEVVSHEDGLSIPGLILLPGEQLFVFVPVEKSRNLSPDNIKVEASVFAGEVLLGLGKPVLGQEYPVSWEGFDGEVRENRALLSWKVNKEKGNKGFVIEYSPNGKSFTDITLVPGSEDHTDLLTYQFESEPLTVGRHMFRLRQVGFDGSSSHTRQVELFIGCERPASINLSSIDPRQGGYASIMVQKGQQAKISLADHQGRTLKVLYEGFMNPLLSYEIFVDQQKMLPGEYQIVMEGNTDKIFREFTVERS